jgi:hypothetical protein
LIRILPFLALFIQFNFAWATSRSYLVFDLDRTLFNPNPRIARILHDIGTERKIPSLLHLSPAQIEKLVSGDRSHLGLSGPELEDLFGSYTQGTNRTSLFGKKFYFDAHYLQYDELIPGAPEFVERISRLLDADVIYLSGRLDGYFRAKTLEQLARFDFTGFGKHSDRAGRVHLMLKPESGSLKNDEFKIEELKGWIGDGRVIAVFDDSSRNLLKFKEWLPDSVPIIRIAAHSAKSSESIPEGTIRIKDYTSSPELIEEILKRAKACSLLSGG